MAKRGKAKNLRPQDQRENQALKPPAPIETATKEMKGESGEETQSQEDPVRGSGQGEN